MPKHRIYAFSKYLGYAVGGAERSVFAILRERQAEGHPITLLRVEGLTTFGADRVRMDIPAGWEVRSLTLPVDRIRPKFLTCWRNRAHVIATLAGIEPDGELYTYGLYAPAAVLGYRGPSLYMVRDEVGLGWDINYQHGLRWIAAAVLRTADAPWRQLWLTDLRACLRRSRLLTNSRFMAAELSRLAGGREVEIVPPAIDAERLRRDFAAARWAGPQGVVAVGDEPLKGAHLVRAAARALPEIPFYLFDRRYTAPIRQGNLTLMPWQTDPTVVYRAARLVIVPSQWHEANPRMVREALVLGIPVLGSRRGGIPESLDEHPQWIIDDYRSAAAWTKAIRQTLTTAATTDT